MLCEKRASIVYTHRERVFEVSGHKQFAEQLRWLFHKKFHVLFTNPRERMDSIIVSSRLRILVFADNAA